MKIEQLKNGIKITWEEQDADTIQDLKEGKISEYVALWNIMDDPQNGYIGNGWAIAIASDLGHLSEAILISNDLDVDDNGEMIMNTAYADNLYQIRSIFDNETAELVKVI